MSSCPGVSMSLVSAASISAMATHTFTSLVAVDFFAMLDCLALRGFSGSFENSRGAEMSFAGDLRDFRVLPFVGVSETGAGGSPFETFDERRRGFSEGVATFGAEVAGSALLLDSMLEKAIGSAL